jgi:integrase
MQALIHDAVRLLALSGMRLEEMARMKVGHLRDLEGPLPYIDLRGTKTKAARRQVPIHPDALPIILRRAVGKDPDAYVLHELTTPPPDSTMDRGHAAKHLDTSHIGRSQAPPPCASRARATATCAVGTVRPYRPIRFALHAGRPDGREPFWNRQRSEAGRLGAGVGQRNRRGNERGSGGDQTAVRRQPL